VGYRAGTGRRHSAVVVATILVATAITTLGLSASPAGAEELAPTAKLAVALALRLPADEAKRQIKAYRAARALLPPQPQVADPRAAVAAPPVCRDAFPPGVARNICGQILKKIRSGAKMTAKCTAGVVAVVARPMGKTVAYLAKWCGPPAAVVALGAALAFLNKKCKAILPWPIDYTCDLLF
jgi:hypothetical protein